MWSIELVGLFFWFWFGFCAFFKACSITHAHTLTGTALSDLALDCVFLLCGLDMGVKMTNEENKQSSDFCNSCCKKRQK